MRIVCWRFTRNVKPFQTKTIQENRKSCWLQQSLLALYRLIYLDYDKLNIKIILLNIKKIPSATRVVPVLISVQIRQYILLDQWRRFYVHINNRVIALNNVLQLRFANLRHECLCVFTQSRNNSENGSMNLQSIYKSHLSRIKFQEQSIYVLRGIGWYFSFLFK